jgi:5-methylcytosine-specific restriction protein A
VSGWQGSNRRQRLPADWNQRRAATLRRDPICRCPGCARCTTHGCSRPSTDADHRIAGDNHDDLIGKCSECHRLKSSREGHAARSRFPVKRPPERHPGMR